jgi:hypothetical protein
MIVVTTYFIKINQCLVSWSFKFLTGEGRGGDGKTGGDEEGRIKRPIIFMRKVVQ